MNARTIIFGAMITVLAGCSLAPVYERPSLPTATVYPGENAAQTQIPADAPQFGWREFFTDAGLRKLIAQAIENNRDLRMAAKRVEEARGLYGIRRANRLPSISASAAHLFMIPIY